MYVSSAPSLAVLWATSWLTLLQNISTRVLPMCYNARPLETQMASNTLRLNCGWFWYWICGESSLWPSSHSAPQELQRHHWLDRFQICGHQHHMGLHSTNVSNYNDRIHQQRPHTLWASRSQKKKNTHHIFIVRLYTAPKSNMPPQWCQYISTTRCKGHKMVPRCHQLPPVLCASCWQQATHDTQCNWRLPSLSYGEHPQQDQ